MRNSLAILLLLSACGSAESGAETPTQSATEVAASSEVQQAGETSAEAEAGEASTEATSAEAEAGEGSAETKQLRTQPPNQGAWAGNQQRAHLLLISPRSELLRREQAMLTQMEEDLEALGFEAQVARLDTSPGGLADANAGTVLQAVTTVLSGEVPIFPAEWEAAGLVVILRLRDPYERNNGRQITMGLSDVVILRAPDRHAVYLERAVRDSDDHRRGDFAESGAFLREYLELEERP